MAITIADVAAEAGVSPATVSQTLNGNRAVAESTRKRILEVVERMDYRPNQVAKGLRIQKTYSVALIVADIANPYYPVLARAVHDVIDPKGYVTLICNTNGEAEAEERFIQQMIARGVDGIILPYSLLGISRIRELVGSEMPLVLTDASGEVDSDEVVTDDSEGIRAAIIHLLERGKTEVGFVSGPNDSGPGKVRLEAFRKACEELDVELQEDWIMQGPFTREGGHIAGRRLLHDSDKRPQAIMCANDLIAIGVMDSAREMGVSFPSDLAIIGFDDIDTASLLSPGLTTVNNPAALAGKASAETLLRRFDSKTRPYERTILPTRLVIRGTT